MCVFVFVIADLMFIETPLKFLWHTALKKEDENRRRRGGKKKQQQNSENNKTIRIDFECVMLLEMRLLHVHRWPPMLPTYISTCIYIALHPRFILFQFGVRESGR